MTEHDELHSAYLSTKDLAARLKVTLGTLANWRVQRMGPSFIKPRGHVLYPVGSVMAWEQKHRTETEA
ncbi:helix-turn-helix domain-containing protein [Ramlibacter sp. G-1-2-2]|uniref:Helix-turn-helix domain-containing protein n=1 Tax=Ramlibacter agri TaxID=2728837 RepID=A0A848H553_9BURK|nr:helix-turn-helix domain-containing protein [Ramlibacter agri]